MKKNYNFLVSLMLVVLAGAVLIVIFKPKPPIQQAGEQNGKVSETHRFGFGKISMAAGKVQHLYEVKNDTTKPLTITKVYTSCMCTEASLRHGPKELGPFGMPGHSGIPEISETLAPEEAATVVITFDPAAHGPAGIGMIEREVILETTNGQPLKIAFSAEVQP